MKIKFHRIILFGYGGGVIGGLLVSVIGIVTNHRGLAKIGLIVALATGLIFSIPLVVAISLSFGKWIRDRIKRKPQ